MASGGRTEEIYLFFDLEKSSISPLIGQFSGYSFPITDLARK